MWLPLQRSSYRNIPYESKARQHGCMEPPRWAGAPWVCLWKMFPKSTQNLVEKTKWVDPNLRLASGLMLRFSWFFHVDSCSILIEARIHFWNKCLPNTQLGWLCTFHILSYPLFFCFKIGQRGLFRIANDSKPQAVNEVSISKPPAASNVIASSLEHWMPG